ncbi:TAXI family TRAP transporter solute-binding subunit [Rhodocyclaceae bacterium SMB388]
MKGLVKTLVAVATGVAVVSGAAVAQDRTGWPRDLTVGTASQGGTYFVYGNGVASFIGESLGLNSSGEVTGGPVQNVTLVQMKEHGIGLVTMGPMYEAWNGRSDLAPGLPHTDVRALFPMYQTPFQCVSMANSGIKSVSDLGGKRVSVGPAGGTPGTYWPRFMETLGVQARQSNTGAADAASQLKDGLLDAFCFAAGIPISAFSQLAAEANVVMFGFNDQELPVILEKHPEVSALTIRAGTYAGHDYDQNTVAMWNFAVAHKDMPDSLAYEVTKLVMDNHERMMQVHSAARETLPENVDKNSFLPFHAGAVRYYEETGVTIPASLRD